MSDKCSRKYAHFYVQHGMQLYILIIQKSSVICMWQNWCVSSIFVRHGHYWRKIVRQCCTVYMCICSACFGWVESLRKWVGSGWVQHFGPMSISESSSAVMTGCTVSMPKLARLFPSVSLRPPQEWQDDLLPHGRRLTAWHAVIVGISSSAAQLQEQVVLQIYNSRIIGVRRLQLTDV